MILEIETDPCAECDFSPCVCGQDIENCMRHERNRADYDAGYQEFLDQMHFEANEALKGAFDDA